MNLSDYQNHLGLFIPAHPQASLLKDSTGWVRVEAQKSVFPAERNDFCNQKRSGLALGLKMLPLKAKKQRDNIRLKRGALCQKGKDKTVGVF